MWSSLSLMRYFFFYFSLFFNKIYSNGLSTPFSILFIFPWVIRRGLCISFQLPTFPLQAHVLYIWVYVGVCLYVDLFVYISIIIKRKKTNKWIRIKNEIKIVITESCALKQLNITLLFAPPTTDVGMFWLWHRNNNTLAALVKCNTSVLSDSTEVSTCYKLARRDSFLMSIHYHPWLKGNVTYLHTTKPYFKGELTNT